MRRMDLCVRCCKLLCEKEGYHKFLAYKETIEEVTNESATTSDPTNTTLAQRLRWVRR